MPHNWKRKQTRNEKKQYMFEYNKTYRDRMVNIGGMVTHWKSIKEESGCLNDPEVARLLIECYYESKGKMVNLSKLTVLEAVNIEEACCTSIRPDAMDSPDDENSDGHYSDMDTKEEFEVDGTNYSETMQHTITTAEHSSETNVTSKMYTEHDQSNSNAVPAETSTNTDTYVHDTGRTLDSPGASGVGRTVCDIRTTGTGCGYSVKDEVVDDDINNATNDDVRVKMEHINYDVQQEVPSSVKPDGSMDNPDHVPGENNYINTPGDDSKRGTDHTVDVDLRSLKFKLKVHNNGKGKTLTPMETKDTVQSNATTDTVQTKASPDEVKHQTRSKSGKITKSRKRKQTKQENGTGRALKKSKIIDEKLEGNETKGPKNEKEKPKIMCEETNASKDEQVELKVGSEAKKGSKREKKPRVKKAPKEKKTSKVKRETKRKEKAKIRRESRESGETTEYESDEEDKPIAEPRAPWQHIKLEDHPDKYTIEKVESFERRNRGSEVFECMYSCLICKQFKSVGREVFEEHLEYHVNRVYECSKCAYVGFSNSDMYKHRGSCCSSKKGREYVCHLCGKRTISRAEKAEHMGVAHDVPEIPCRWCKELFTTKNLRKKHYRAVHTEQCQYCDSCKMGLSKLSRAEYKKHIEDCVPGHQCQYCGKLFTRKQGLDSHVTFTHLKVRKYTCKMCPYTATTPEKLKLHVLAHQGIRPYSCDQCTFTCVQPYQLKSHMRTHTGEKPFKCDQCNYAAAWNVQLKEHKKVHTSDTAAFCLNCNIMFKNINLLTAHHKKGHCMEDGNRISSGSISGGSAEVYRPPHVTQSVTQASAPPDTYTVSPPPAPVLSYSYQQQVHQQLTPETQYSPQQQQQMPPQSLSQQQPTQSHSQQQQPAPNQHPLQQQLPPQTISQQVSSQQPTQSLSQQQQPASNQHPLQQHMPPQTLSQQVSSQQPTQSLSQQQQPVSNRHPLPQQMPPQTISQQVSSQQPTQSLSQQQQPVSNRHPLQQLASQPALTQLPTAQLYTAQSLTQQAAIPILVQSTQAVPSQLVSQPLSQSLPQHASQSVSRASTRPLTQSGIRSLVEHLPQSLVQALPQAVINRPVLQMQSQSSPQSQPQRDPQSVSQHENLSQQLPPQSLAQPMTLSLSQRDSPSITQAGSQSLRVMPPQLLAKRDSPSTTQQAPQSFSQAGTRSPAQRDSPSATQHAPQLLAQAVTQSLGQLPPQTIAQASTQSLGQLPSHTLAQRDSPSTTQQAPQLLSQSFGQLPPQTIAQSLGHLSIPTLVQAGNQSLPQRDLPSTTQQAPQLLAQAVTQSLGQLPTQSLSQSGTQSLGQLAPHTLAQPLSQQAPLSVLHDVTPPPFSPQAHAQYSHTPYNP